MRVPWFRTRFHSVIVGSITAAIAVSLTVAGALIGHGWGPSSQTAATSAPPLPPARAEERSERGAQSRACANCGVVESIRAVEIRGESAGDSQLGRGRGNAVATVVGAYDGQEAAGAKRTV